MQKKCDLYLCDSVVTDRLKFVALFDKSFVFEHGKAYTGYLNISVDRVKLISVVSDLRKNGFNSFSVPIEYKDHGNVPISHALCLANEHARNLRASAVLQVGRKSKCPPVIWCFDLRYEHSSDEKSGGVVMVDRVDGHVWTSLEYEEYMYDYNNLF